MYSRLTAVLIFVLAARPSFAQAVQHLTFSTEIGPTSGHILTGHAEERRTFFGSVAYDHRVLARRGCALSYLGTMTPLFLEGDPVAVGVRAVSSGGTVTTQMLPKPMRVLSRSSDPIFVTQTGGGTISYYNVYGSDEYTYGGGLSPFGLRLTLRDGHQIEALFSIASGFLITTREVPIDTGSSFNFTYSFGPGVAFRVRGSSAIVGEVLVTHVSNGGLADNPAIDSVGLKVGFRHSF